MGNAYSKKTKFCFVGDLWCKPEHTEFVKTELYQLVQATRVEHGCMDYEFHQDIEKPDHFVIVGRWKTTDDWRAHMESKHLVGAMEVMRGKLEKEWGITKLRRIEVAATTQVL